MIHSELCSACGGPLQLSVGLVLFTVIVVGEVLTAKNHNQDIQNYTRKILFICKEP